MQLIDKAWTPQQNKYMNTWQADTKAEVTADFDPEGAVGSAIVVIEEGAVYLKNSAGKWQKYGTTEVI